MGRLPIIVAAFLLGSHLTYAQNLELDKGTYHLQIQQGNSWVAFDVPSVCQISAYVPGILNNTEEQFVWDGKTLTNVHMMLYTCPNTGLAEGSGGNVTLTGGDRVILTWASGGFVIQNTTTGHYLTLSGTCQAGFSNCIVWGAIPSVWQFN